MENQKNREADLAALNELKNDYIQIYSLEKEIKTEEKRIEELKENMNRHGLKPPKSEANKVRLAAYRPKCKKVDTISNIFFAVYLIVGLAMMVLLAVEVFFANGEFLLRNSNMSWHDYSITGIAPQVFDWGIYSSFVFVILAEIPFIVLLIIFGRLIKNPLQRNLLH